MRMRQSPVLRGDVYLIADSKSHPAVASREGKGHLFRILARNVTFEEWRTISRREQQWLDDDPKYSGYYLITEDVSRGSAKAEDLLGISVDVMVGIFVDRHADKESVLGYLKEEYGSGTVLLDGLVESRVS